MSSPEEKMYRQARWDGRASGALTALHALQAPLAIASSLTGSQAGDLAVTGLLMFFLVTYGGLVALPREWFRPAFLVPDLAERVVVVSVLALLLALPACGHWYMFVAVLTIYGLYYLRILRSGGRAW